MPAPSPPSPRRSRGRQRLGAQTCAGLLAFVLVGCERQLPGPDDCVLFAQVWLRANRPPARDAQALEGAFDELVRQCLTEPYDRKLVDCVLDGRAGDRCRADYARRVEARRERRHAD